MPRPEPASSPLRRALVSTEESATPPTKRLKTLDPDEVAVLKILGIWDEIDEDED